MEKSTKKFKNGFVAFLCFGMLLSTLPLVNAQVQKSDEYEVGEMVEKREMYSKHFQNEDGTIRAVTYNEPIHYQDSNGDWKNIDNTIISDVSYQLSGFSKKVNKEQYYTSKDNPYIKVLFNKETSKTNLIKLNMMDMIFHGESVIYKIPLQVH